MYAVIKHNKALLVMTVFFASLPYYFIELLLIRSLGFSYSVIGLLSVVTQIFGMVFDIPLSFLAHKVGYKKIMIASHLLLCLGLFSLVQGSIVAAFCSAVFMGLSESLSSGVLSSYTFELFESEPDYENFLKNANTLKYIFIALVTIISPLLLKWSVAYPLYLSLLIVAISLAALLMLPEVMGSEEVTEEHSLFHNLSQVPWQMIVFGVVFSSLLMVNNQYASLILLDYHFPLDYLGVLLFLFNLMMALGSHLKLRWQAVLFLPLCVLAVSFVQTNFALVPLFLVIRMLNANYVNQFAIKMNGAISGDRAVAWSIYNFAISLSFIVVDLVAGFMADVLGLSGLYRFFGALACLYALYYLIRQRLSK